MVDDGEFYLSLIENIFNKSKLLETINIGSHWAKVLQSQQSYDCVEEITEYYDDWCVINILWVFLNSAHFIVLET